ncbi:exosome component 7 [Phyllostomus discolor]|uniref:Ribosomal RNA-processing protein 42 n=1 Tax=Phyllostomus discolor TaxID=89673 RepID=A0A834E0Q3_9CHIR|nr:exosome component 7 [Phyllostomus discolor]
MASVSLSEAEKVYIVHGVQEDLRVDGRGCEDYRGVEVETDVVSNTSGSARVRLGHTDILVGVKAEMGTPKLEKPNEGYLEFFVDCSANATPEFEGRGGDDLGTEIANTLYRIFHNKSSVDLEALCISPREHCWVLYVDVLLLECGGNLFDAISIAVKAALFNTRNQLQANRWNTAPGIVCALLSPDLPPGPDPSQVSIADTRFRLLHPRLDHIDLVG